MNTEVVVFFSILLSYLKYNFSSELLVSDVKFCVQYYYINEDILVIFFC